MSGELLTLQSSDGQEFELEVKTAKMSETIKHLIEDAGVEDNMKYHIENPLPEGDESAEKRTDDIIPWDKDFMNVDQATMFELILAANYLDVKDLLDLTCKTVANLIKGKTPEEIRKTFNIKNEFTPEEEEAVRKENEWCEER